MLENFIHDFIFPPLNFDYIIDNYTMSAGKSQEKKPELLRLFDTIYVK